MKWQREPPHDRIVERPGNVAAVTMFMSRAGVRPDISERVLGHVIAGVEGVYDRYEYVAEKRTALEQLAQIVQQIVSAPPAGGGVSVIKARK